jgi:hypothetical protein
MAFLEKLRNDLEEELVRVTRNASTIAEGVRS